MPATTRVLTCGSVDDGKSTLIGRLLYDTGQLHLDQIDALASESRRFGTQGDDLDYALLLDGLQDEKRAGITIDVAYRYFSLGGRSFVFLDTPGHEQYTRNMALAATATDAAVILVDSSRGITEQTRRHLGILRLFGVRQLAIAMNKMDLTADMAESYSRLAAEFESLVAEMEFESTVTIPTVATTGANVAKPADFGWYSGPTVLEWLGDLPDRTSLEEGPLRLPVQLVIRPDSSFRGYAGRLVQGSLGVGNRVKISGLDADALVSSITVAGRDAQTAMSGDSVCVTLDKELDVARGNVISDPGTPVDTTAHFRASLLWLSTEPLVPAREYLLKLKYAATVATVTSIRGVLDLATGASLSARTIATNEIGMVQIALQDNLAFTPYKENRDLGGFILIERATGATVAAGIIEHSLRRDKNIHWQEVTIDKTARAAAKRQKPCCIWLTGLSGSGKSTIANLLERKLHSEGRHTYLLDGDNVRHGLNSDLGFEEADRAENIRRVAEVSKLMVDAGLIVIVAFISPYRADRDRARSLFEDGEFIEVFVDTALELCEARDPKGLYARAREGIIPNFTGISAPYEAPESPEVWLRTEHQDATECASQVEEAIPLFESP